MDGMDIAKDERGNTRWQYGIDEDVSGLTTNGSSWFDSSKIKKEDIMEDSLSKFEKNPSSLGLINEVVPLSYDYYDSHDYELNKSENEKVRQCLDGRLHGKITSEEENDHADRMNPGPYDLGEKSVELKLR